MTITSRIRHKFDLSFEEFIQKYYKEEDKTMKEVAELIDSNPASICNWMKKLGVSTEKIRKCDHCDKEFKTKNNQQYLCSKSCRNKKNWPKEKEAHKKARKKRGLDRKRELIKLKGGKCKECEENNLYKLCFHHRDGEEKRFTLDQKTLYQKKYKEIKVEAEKCDLYCQNCHAILHEKDRIKDRKDQNRYAKGRGRKRQLIQLRGGSCEECGFSSEFTQSLSFDHIDEFSKKFELNVVNLQKYGFDKIMEEFQKCRLLCMNCHIGKNKDRLTNQSSYNASTGNIDRS